MKKLFGTETFFPRRFFRSSFLFVPVFLLLCHFSFAGDIKVIGAVPKTDTGKTYQLQIGAFTSEENVKKAVDTLKRNGFDPRCENIVNEKNICLTRVFVTAGAKDVCAAINGLGRAGFKVVIIREYSLKPETGKPTVETKSEPPKEEITQDEPPQIIPEKIPLERQALDFERDPVKFQHLFLSLYSK